MPDCSDGIVSGGASPVTCETCGGMGDLPGEAPERGDAEAKP